MEIEGGVGIVPTSIANMHIGALERRIAVVAFAVILSVVRVHEVIPLTRGARDLVERAEQPVAADNVFGVTGKR